MSVPQDVDSEVKARSLRIAHIAGGDTLKAPEIGRFSDEVLVVQGRADPKISSPLSEILFHKYSYKYSILLQYYCNTTITILTIGILLLTH
jgi:hypothetical protein